MNLEKLSVPIAIIISGGLIAGALYYSNIKASRETAKIKATQSSGEVVSIDMRPVSALDHMLGNPNADIIIVEYSDLECPFCKQFYPTLQRVMI